MVGPDRTHSAGELSRGNLAQLDPRVLRPTYDRGALKRGIVHVGVGGFHRAHQAVYLDDLCEQGLTDWSITGAGVMPGDTAMAAALRPQDYLYTLITRDGDTTDVRIIGSIVDYVLALTDIEPLAVRMAQPETRVVSLTITEGGYPVDDVTGDFITDHDGQVPAAFLAIARALQIRRAQGSGGFTVLSCDNIMHNGAIARAATLGVAAMVQPGLEDWARQNVSFPNAMVDRITPATTPTDREFLRDEYSLVDRWPVVSEPFIQWVIEDSFPYGRPPWEDAGALFTADVQPYETLKLRILNAGHSCLAYLAALVGHTYVHEVLADAPFDRFLRHFLDEEVSPSLPPVPGIDVTRYKKTVARRFANPEVRDQVSRICLDGSSKFPKFLVPTVEAQLDKGGQVKLAALALAGWCQYHLGKDDEGRDLEVANDPKLSLAASFAEASRNDPAAFLGFSGVFGTRLPRDPMFVSAFVTALEVLRVRGAYATLDLWLSDTD